MKINIKNCTRRPSFGMIEEGDAFFFEESIYIKIFSPDSGELNAVNLEDGMGYWFDDDSPIEYANVTICLAEEVS